MNRVSKGRYNIRPIATVSYKRIQFSLRAILSIIVIAHCEEAFWGIFP